MTVNLVLRAGKVPENEVALKYIRTECSEVRTETIKPDTPQVRLQASLGESYFTIKTAQKSSKVILRDHSGQCPFQYFKNIEPTMKQSDWLILDIYWLFEFIVLLLRAKNNPNCSFCDKSMKLPRMTNLYKVNIF